VSNDLHVLTGAPGTGKTSMLHRAGRAVTVVAEPARRVLASWHSEGNPRPAQIDPDTFVRRITELTIRDHADAQGEVVFDRGAIDCLVYARYLGSDPALPARAARLLPFGGLTFLATPWLEIYSTDEERTMTFQQVLRFHEVLLDTYAEFGVDLIEVPRASVETRAAFLLDRVA
jgi:predicted ATPase